MASMVMMLLCVVVTCMVVAAPYAEAVVTCTQVTTDLAPCVGYLVNGSSSVPGACCSGVQTLNQEAETTADRQAVCNCIQALSGSISGINFDLAGGLPEACGVNLNTNINANTNCEQIQ